eukprot:sb/3472066/
MSKAEEDDQPMSSTAAVEQKDGSSNLFDLFQSVKLRALDEYRFKTKQTMAPGDPSKAISSDTEGLASRVADTLKSSEDEVLPEEDEEEEEEEEMVVLDPEHPLMARMQDALTKYLTKQIEKLDLELKEKLAELKKQTADREELGVNLYGIQQQLAKQQLIVGGLEENNNLTPI